MPAACCVMATGSASPPIFVIRASAMGHAVSGMRTATAYLSWTRDESAARKAPNPDFRIFDNDLGRQAKLDAYQQYEAELTSAYRNPPRLVDAAKPPPDPEEDEDEHETDPASDRRMVDASELQSHRERTLRPVYDAYALELSQAWRKR